MTDALSSFPDRVGDFALSAQKDCMISRATEGHLGLTLPEDIPCFSVLMFCIYSQCSDFRMRPSIRPLRLKEEVVEIFFGDCHTC